MPTVLFAQPYDLSASGFYFHDVEEYAQKVSEAHNDYGQPVEEFEIQFIEGEDNDCSLAAAVGLNQCNFPQYLELIEELDEYEKIELVIAVGECGYRLEEAQSDLDIELYEMNTVRELAEQFVDAGLLGEIPENLQMYFDYDALARDLEIDYSSVDIAGRTFIYRCV